MYLLSTNEETMLHLVPVTIYVVINYDYGFLIKGEHPPMFWFSHKVAILEPMFHSFRNGASLNVLELNRITEVLPFLPAIG